MLSGVQSAGSCSLVACASVGRLIFGHMLIGRMFIVMIVLITYLLTFFPPPGIFDLAVWCFSGFASLFPLVFASLYWRRVTREGAIACVIAVAVSWSWLFYNGLVARPEGQEGDYLVAGMMPVAIMFGISVLTLIVVSLLTRPLPKEQVERFFPTPSKLA